METSVGVRGPVFVGIGAARSGTTWLSENLKRSPEVWLPRRKELHYFTRARSYPSSSFMLGETFRARFFGRTPDHDKFRRDMLKAFGNDLLHPSREQFTWNMRFYFGRISDEWYLSLFPADRISGEITPAYALMDDDDVRAFAELLPGVKVIYLMRDPVARAWSTIRYHETRGQVSLQGASEERVKALLSQEGVTARSQYPDVIRRWRRCVPAERLLIACYDDIIAAPQELMRAVLALLGVRDQERVLGHLRTERVNASAEKTMPAAIERYLSRQYLPMLEELVSVYDSDHVRAWLERARAAAC